MADASIQVTVGADVSQVVSGMKTIEQEGQSLQSQLILLDRAITNAISRGADTAALEQSFDEVTAKIRTMNEAAAQSASSQGLGGIPTQLQAIQGPAAAAGNSLSTLGLNTTQARVAFLDLGRIVTGQGFSLRSLAANFSLLGPAVTIAAAAIYGIVELLTKQTDAQKKASEEAKRLTAFMLDLKDASEVSEQSTGSQAGDIARVQALAAVILDTNNAYKQRKTALDELRETNKSYFGDLTLEQASMKLLTERVNEYSQALITEAVVKGQVEEIAKLSEELQKQIPILSKYAQAKADAQRGQAVAVSHPDAPDQQGLSANVTAAGDQLTYTTNLFDKQNEVVAKLSAQISEYTGVLNDNIKTQSEQRPLKIAPPPVDDLKSILPILEQIQTIYNNLAKPNKEPLFKQEDLSNRLKDPSSTQYQILEDKIQEAFANGIAKGANDPKIKTAYDALATALQAQLNAERNPNLSSHINFGLANPADAEKIVTQYQSEIEKAAAKGSTIKIPAHFQLELQDEGFSPEDAKKIIKGLEDDPGLKSFYFKVTPHIQLAIDKNLIQKADAEKLRETIVDTFSSAAVAGFSDVGKAVGDALTGQKNPLGKAIQDFTKVLGDGLIKIGEQMILGSSIIQGLKVALGTLFNNPAGGIVEGIAAVAIGEAIKNVGAHAFATGGIVTGPTLGVVGEAGPEVIFPLNQLGNFIKTSRPQPQTVIVQGRIRGSDINISSARATRLQNLTS